MELSPAVGHHGRVLDPAPPPRATAAALLGALGACAPPAGAPACGAGAHLEADGLCHLDSVDTGAAPRPDTGAPLPDGALDAAGVGALLDGLLLHGLPRVRDVAELFVGMTLEGDPTCPGLDLAFIASESACHAATGWTYFGHAPWRDELQDADGHVWHWTNLPLASFWIEGPAGERLEGGGSMMHAQQVDGDELPWFAGFMGTWRSTGVGPGWLQRGVSLGWAVEGTRGPAERTLRIHGPIGVGHLYAQIDTLDWSSARCGGVPEVDLRARDAAGRWYRWTSGEGCSPCGPVTLDGVDRGELCLDLSGAVAELEVGYDLPEVTGP
jgi:hypothetical protein